MRKYYQATLAIIATLSLVALLFYRHEYNRLRYVLEVFNYFGRPGEKASPVNCTGLLIASENITALNHANYHFDEPVPSWQRLNEDAYVYSSYAVDDREIRAIGFARVKSLKFLACEIYYENELEPIVGDFSYKMIESSSIVNKNSVDAAKNGIYSGYLFVCTRKSEILGRKRISGVSFANHGQLYPEAVILPVKRFDISVNQSKEIALCVAPSPWRTILQSDMINFISFHNALGVRHFVVYDFGTPQRFNGIFKKIARKLNTELNFSYATVPWNFPFSRVSNDIAKRVIEADCRYRMYKNAEIVATLTWDEFIVMKYHRSVGKLFRDIDEMGFVADRYKVSTTNLCVERKELESDDDNAKPVVLASGKIDEARPVYLYRSKTDRPFVVNDVDLKTRETTTDVILVNRYERRCNHSLTLIAQDDPYVGKFAKSIKRSPISELFQVYAQ